ncbi:MAG: hypothetical protein ACRDJ4_13095 [Actinomycetota bacterium]
MPLRRLTRAVVVAALLGVVFALPRMAMADVDVTVIVDPAGPATPAVQAPPAPQPPSSPVHVPMTGADIAATLTAALALLAAGLLLLKVRSTQRIAPTNERNG